MSIKEAYDACPIKAEYFKSIEKKEKKKKSSKFKNELLSSLDSFLEELTPKKYEFITDGIETKKDISHLGMSERQLKKLNRVCNAHHLCLFLRIYNDEKLPSDLIHFNQIEFSDSIRVSATH